MSGLALSSHNSSQQTAALEDFVGCVLQSASAGVGDMPMYASRNSYHVQNLHSWFKGLKLLCHTYPCPEGMVNH